MAKHYVKSKNLELMAEAMAAITYGTTVDDFVISTARSIKIGLPKG